MYDLIGDVHGYAHALVEVEFGLCERSEAIYLSSRTVLQTRHGAAVMDCHVAPLLAETTGVMDCRVATLLTGTLGLLCRYTSCRDCSCYCDITFCFAWYDYADQNLI